ncbi:caspase domain-containing protein [Flavobacterium sp.]|uniref:caspase family protein n=1 Tax=Flavobacterium sp. TaxID=239 RepID=UPI00391AEABA
MANYAIIIGINNYTKPEDAGLKELQGAIRDAKEIYTWMINKGDVKKSNCYLILSTDALYPIKNDVDNAITEITKAVIRDDDSDADRFYFYFAGHGLGVELDKENNGMCMANWSEYQKDSAALSTTDYKKKFLNEGLFKEIVMWMDCCRNTKMYFNPHGAPSRTPLGQNTDPLFFTAFATNYQNQAFEATVETASGKETRGVFTTVLLKGLYGDASENGVDITARDMCDYLAYHVPIKAQEAGYTQIPDPLTNETKHKKIIFKI